MQTLDYSHDAALVIASFFVALIAGFTGLTLTTGLSEKTEGQKKLAITLAAIAMGGGIWSMHFVAMLGLKLPVMFYYDAAVTLGSALVAILVVGIGFLILHFFERTRASLLAAGVTVGLGVLAMHYIGMAGLQLCRPIYSTAGIVGAIVASCTLCSAAFWAAYGQRSQRNILFGTLGFGCAVFAVHFIAIGGTAFVAVDGATQVGPLISNQMLAVGVVVTSFVLCGAFLLSGVTFLQPAENAHPEQPAPSSFEALPTTAEAKPMRMIPYEHSGKTLFLDPASVAAIRAEGHYTHLYAQTGKHFCAWSMTEAEKRLSPELFVKAHRSYLINPEHVASFERLKDNGVCHFDLACLSKVPVSRSQLKAVRAALGV